MSNDDSNQSENENKRPDEVELHDLEKKRQSDIPKRRHAEDTDILAERIISGDLPVVAVDGKGFIGPFERANRKLSKGKHGLKNYILPFKIQTKRRDDVKIRRNQKFYFEKIEGHVGLDKAKIDTNGRILITLTETNGNYPRRSWTFRTVDLARYIESGELKTMEEINDEAEEILNSFSDTGGEVDAD